MTLRDQLTHDLKEAMRAKDKLRLGAIRMLQAAITEKDKSGNGPVADDDLVAIVQKQAKQRRDAIAQYTEAGRADLAHQEADELTVIEGYLPPQLSDEAIREAVQAIVKRTGATSMKDMGRVMGQAMGALKGQADGKRVQAIVRELLSA